MLLPRLLVLFLLTMSIGFAQTNDPAVDADAVQILIDDMEYHNAMARVEAAIKKHKNNDRLLLQRGFVLVQLGRLSDAKSHYKKLIRRLKKNPEPGNNLAVVYRMERNYDDAIKRLIKTIKAFPDYAKAYENLGDTYIEMATEQYQRGTDQIKDNEVLDSKLETATRFAEIAASNTPTAKRKQAALLEAEQEATKVAQLSNPEDDAMLTLGSWITTWSDRDVDNYLLHYSREFQPEDGLTLAEWIARKRAIISTAEYIQINLDEINIEQVDKDLVIANFIQTYESNLLATRSLKSLTLRQYEGSWLIIKEESRPLQ